MIGKVTITLHGPAYMRRARLPTGVLTCDHPASSYGLPVVVVDGQALGPDDLPTKTFVNCWTIPDGKTINDVLTPAEWDETVALIEGAKSAGYQVRINYAI